ncbi:MAG: YcxB family protein [Alphaproteobacteria bacterium]|nr:YcxB family protein [Alphaproteobacteria bacterium]
MATEISLTFTLTREHLVGAWRQHFWMKALRSRSMVFSMTLLGICFVSIVLLAWCCVPTMPVGMFSMILAVAPGLMAFNYFVVVPLSAPRSGVCGMTFDVRIAEDTVSWRGDQVDASLDWARFLDIAESRDYFLLYFGQAAFFAVPKIAFADQSGIEAFRKLIASRKEEVPRTWYVESDARLDEFAGKDGIAMRFRFTEAEQVMLLREVIFGAIARSKSTLVLYGLLFVFAAYGISMILATRLEPIYFVMAAPAMTLFPGLVIYYFFWVKREVRKSPTYGRDQFVSINENEIVIDTGIARTSIAWSGITAITDRGDLVMLRRGADDFLTLAKRGFASADDEARFHEMARRYVPGA